MNKTQRRKELLSRLNELESKKGSNLSGLVDDMVGEEAKKASEEVKVSPIAKAIRELAKELENLKKEPKAQKILSTVAKAERQRQERIDQLEAGFQEQVDTFLASLDFSAKEGQELTRSEIAKIQEQLAKMGEEYEQKRKPLEEQGTVLAEEITKVRQELSRLFEGVSKDIASARKELAGGQKSTASLDKKLEQIARELRGRIAGIQTGGNQNRSILVGGNVNTLSPYTDINLKAGNGITITYQANQTTKYTDITITANGSGSGIVREINSVAVDTAAGDTAGTDYVYLVSGTTTITLPTAVGNENLYTIKNVGSNTVTVAFTGGQTCDGSATLSLPVQYTSVDIISDNTNWNVT